MPPKGKAQETPDETVPDWAKVDPGRALAEVDGTPPEGEIVEPPTGVVAQYGPAMMAVVQWCADNVAFDDADSFAAMNSMVERMLLAESPAQVLEESATIDAKTVLDKPFIINNIRVAESDFNEGFPYYILFDATDPVTKAPAVISCGGFMVVAQVMKLTIEEAWPMVVKFMTSKKPTKAGFSPISLRAAI